MIDFLKKNAFILVAVVLIAAGGVWYSMSGGSEADALLVSDSLDGSVGSEVAAQQRAMLDILFELKSIQLSGTIFTNPAFQSLRDFRTEIVAEPIGRRNPFAPLGHGEAGGIEAE